MKIYEKLHPERMVSEAIVKLWIHKVTPEEAAEMLKEYYRRQAEPPEAFVR